MVVIKSNDCDLRTKSGFENFMWFKTFLITFCCVAEQVGAGTEWSTQKLGHQLNPRLTHKRAIKQWELISLSSECIPAAMDTEPTFCC